MTARGCHETRRAARAAAAMSAVPLVAVIIAGCASPSDSYDDYHSKVHQTAVALISTVATAQLAAGQLTSGLSTGAFADAVVTDAEKDAGSIQTTLDSRQPPDNRSIELKDSADQAIQSAVTGLTDLRIAVRRGDTRGIRQAQGELGTALRQLERLSS